MKKLSIIGMMLVISFSSTGCEEPELTRYNIVEVVKCNDKNGVCIVKIDKEPWVTHIYGPAIVGDYFIERYDVGRMGGYRLSGYDPNFEYDMNHWGDKNEFN
jgi:hypothetical protein